jgi:GntR family transcriptional regulator
MSQRFPYQRIAEELRSEILSGGLAPGTPLPSESELAERYSTARMTIRRALGELRTAGLIVTRHGGRTIVRPRSHVRLLHTGANYRARRASGVANFNAEVAALGQRPEQRILEVATVPAPRDIAERLDLDEGALVVVRRRLFLVDGEPIALGDSYYPLALAEGTPLALPLRIVGGAHAVIEEPGGPIRRTIARFAEDLVARLPTPEEIGILQLLPGSPVVRVLRTVYDSADEPLEVADEVKAADRHEFHYEVEVRP